MGPPMRLRPASRLIYVSTMTNTRPHRAVRRLPILGAVLFLGILSTAVRAEVPTAGMQPTSPAKQRDAQAACDAGRAALDADRLDQASEAFEKALAAWPEMAEAHVGLGHVAMRRRAHEPALKAYQAAREAFIAGTRRSIDAANQRYVEAQRGIVDRKNEIQRLKQGSYIPHSFQLNRIHALEQEIALLEKIDRPTADAHPVVPAEIEFFIGNAAFALGRVDEAIAAWELAVKADRRIGAAHNNLAVAYWKQGNRDKAKAALARAEELGVLPNPEFQKALASAR